MSTKRKAESHPRALNRQRLMKSRGPGVDSERDSGFSDASSEHLSATDPADPEDSPRAAVQQEAPSSGRSSGLTVVGGSYPGLSPMIIMNNVLLKQPGDNPPALKPWGFSPAVEVVQQPQVVFLRPVVSRQPSPASKELSSRHRRPKNYLPILKSYPKIAPHPGDNSGSGSGSGSSGRGTACSSSSSSGSEKSASQACQRDKQQKGADGGSGFSTPAVPSSPSGASVRENPSSRADPSGCASFGTQEDTQAPPDPSESSADIKRKRFCNTYNILSKSGLLDIALRTKELHRQNRRTQSELEQLKEQTELFLQALCSGDAGLCGRLQARLLQHGGGEAPTGSKADGGSTGARR